MIEGVFAFFFLLVPEDLALEGRFKVKSPWKIGGTSTRWAPLSPKFLTHSLTLNHYDLNLGEGSLVLVGEVKGISGLGTNILMIFSFLKAKKATTADRAKVKKCPNMPWSKTNWQANL